MFWSKTKITKIYRKFDKDGKVTEETIETTEDPGKVEDISSVI